MESETYSSGTFLFLRFDFEDFEEKRLKKRKWANPDEQAIDATFSKLDVKSRKWRNLSQKELNEVLDNLFKSRTLENKAGLICLVTSHGDQINGHDLFFTKEGYIRVKDLLERFTVSKCPGLAGKPKIFIFETCRGQAMMTDTGAGPSPEVAKYSGPQIPESDFLIAFATTPGYKAIAHDNYGSMFIQAFVKAVEKEMGRGGDIIRIVTKTSQMLASSNRFPDENDFRWQYFYPGFYVQVSCFMHSLRKRCLLNPIQHRRNSIASIVLDNRESHKRKDLHVPRKGSFDTPTSFRSSPMRKGIVNVRC